MRIFNLFISMLIGSFSFAQMQPIDTVYIVEGIVADRGTLKIIPLAILYNDSLGITTTSDENGYFKIVVPVKLVKGGKHVFIDIVKTGYKRDGSGFSYNPIPTDTNEIKYDKRMIWNYSVEIFWLAKDESELSSTSGSYARSEKGVYNASVIQQTFKEAIASELREEKLEKLKEGNEKIYFKLGKEIGLATNSYDIIVIGKLTHVYINGRKVMLTEINNIAKRSKFFYDRKNSDALTKKYGKETLTFTTYSKRKETPDQFHSIKATLVIEIDN